MTDDANDAEDSGKLNIPKDGSDAKGSVPDPQSLSHIGSPELLERMLSLQEKKIELETKQLALSVQKDNNAFNYSKFSVEKLAEDRKDERVLESKKSGLVFWGIIVGILCFTALAIFSVYQKETALVIELCKYVIPLIVGAVGGYGYGKSKNIEGGRTGESDEVK
jgi:hypothetical protein